MAKFRSRIASPLYGLVLTGGYSTRMQKDKALIAYHGQPHALHLHDILLNYCVKVYLSARPGQWRGTPLDGRPTITDIHADQGPIGGLLSAFQKHPEAYWLVIACDLPNFNSAAVEKLLEHADEQKVAICFKNPASGFPEPLCTLYSPRAGKIFARAFADHERCPRDILQFADCVLLEAGGPIDLTNVNTVSELAEILK